MGLQISDADLHRSRRETVGGVLIIWLFESYGASQSFRSTLAGDRHGCERAINRFGRLAGRWLARTEKRMQESP
ncbi:MAG: hypothetical protein DMG87_19080 [Acidobacteria bacterium]|nr:MAG: hypothetical protein DMG87_19080 [Acidobacteriota bacterium]